MHNSSLYRTIILFATLVACSPEERNYGTDGGDGAGGQGGAGGSDGADPIAAACDSYANAVCLRFQDCSPATIQANFGDFGMCRARYALFCKALLGTEGTGWTPSKLKACGESFASLDCNLYLAQPFRSIDALTPTACVPPKGALLDGAGCLDHGQCQSGHCHRTALSLCGTCGAPGGAGTKCGTNLDCKGSMTCLNSTCAEASEAGAACVQGQMPCNVPWSCLNGTCAKPGSIGDACGTEQPPCNFLQGLYCNMNLSRCENAIFKQPGEACKLPNTGLVLCQGAGVCPQAAGTCIAPVPEGEVCDATNGPGCMAPALCLQGKCTIADSSLCP
jgi:hypothetical protein